MQDQKHGKPMQSHALIMQIGAIRWIKPVKLKWWKVSLKNQLQPASRWKFPQSQSTGSAPKWLTPRDSILLPRRCKAASSMQMSAIRWIKPSQLESRNPSLGSPIGPAGCNRHLYWRKLIPDCLSAIIAQLKRSRSINHASRALIIHKSFSGIHNKTKQKWITIAHRHTQTHTNNEAEIIDWVSVSGQSSD